MNEQTQEQVAKTIEPCNKTLDECHARGLFPKYFVCKFCTSYIEQTGLTKEELEQAIEGVK